MTEIEDLVSYYSNLLIKQYHDRPRAVATIEALAEQDLSDLVWMSVRAAFDVDTAAGVQLDTLGKYVGADRKPDGVTELTDTEYRLIIKMKIIKNLSDHTMKSINDYLYLFFGDQIQLKDNKDMTITYWFPLTIIATMTLAVQADLLPRPSGVAIILSGILNPNGDFGYSRLGTPDHLINGYGVNGIATYEGGTYMRVIWV